MPNSQNGYPVIAPNDPDAPRLRRFVVPTENDPTTPDTVIPLRDGSTGFLLVWLALWFNVKIEMLWQAQLDDWGYAYRVIAGSDTYSNHASGTAEDLNATKHGRGLHTYTKRQRFLLGWVLRFRLRGCIVGGYTWSNPDDMHFEIAKNLSTCEARARKLMGTKRGKAILAANPGLREVILS